MRNINIDGKWFRKGAKADQKEAKRQYGGKCIETLKKLELKFIEQSDKLYSLNKKITDQGLSEYDYESLLKLSECLDAEKDQMNTAAEQYSIIIGAPRYDHPNFEKYSHFFDSVSETIGHELNMREEKLREDNQLEKCIFSINKKINKKIGIKKLEQLDKMFSVSKIKAAKFVENINNGALSVFSNFKDLKNLENDLVNYLITMSRLDGEYTSISGDLHPDYDAFRKNIGITLGKIDAKISLEVQRTKLIEGELN